MRFLKEEAYASLKGKVNLKLDETRIDNKKKNER